MEGWSEEDDEFDRLQLPDEMAPREAINMPQSESMQVDEEEDTSASTPGHAKDLAHPH